MHRSSAQPSRPRRRAARAYSRRRIDVVDAARPDDHQQAVVVAVEDRVRLGAPAQQHLTHSPLQRQLLEQRLRRDQRHEPLDPLVADGVALDRWRQRQAHDAPGRPARHASMLRPLTAAAARSRSM